MGNGVGESGMAFPRASLLVAIAASTATLASSASAAQVDVAGPPGSAAFGTSVSALPNGNFVVVDPFGPQLDVGAVYLYAANGTLLSTLTGSTYDDLVGLGGIILLGENRFLILSPFWNNGPAAGAGAVTWVDGNVGLEGEVSPANSLVGQSEYDSVGSGGVKILRNGNFVVLSPNWGDGSTHHLGAVTWGDATSGVLGPVSTANSLVGSTEFDFVGENGVVALANGNYVVDSASWSNGIAFGDFGAVTWGNGDGGTVGPVSVSNSLVGATTGDTIGAGGVSPLQNGNYVVSSPTSSNGSTIHAGAVTWGNGAGGTVGPISDANSLVGTSPDDRAGMNGVTALANGNYVVSSPVWDNGSITDVGAVTWGNGLNGVAGPISAANSLVGTSTGDSVGAGGAYALTNGDYVVVSFQWNHGSNADVGAVTWMDGSSAGSAEVTSGNSLIGTATDDQVGVFGVVPLPNGNYVVMSPYWNNGGALEAGAVTWGNGAGGTTGEVSAANSLVGTTEEDQVGRNGVTPLDDGNYVVASSWWSNGAAGMAGAATWGNGAGGTVGPVAISNSLTGTTAGDSVGSDGIIALPGGNYAVASSYWSNGAQDGVGAVTWCRTGGITTGLVSATNSLIGAAAGDHVGFPVMRRFNDGNFVVKSSEWGNGGATLDGAVTLASGSFRLAGHVAAWNSVTGGIAGGGRSMSYAYDPVHHRLIVGRPYENRVSIFTLDQPFADGFDP